MSSILVPSGGPDSWRQLLAKPDLHWATGYSARTLAHVWGSASGFPPEYEAIAAAYGPVEPLLIMPEHKTALTGGRRESQSDVFVLLRHVDGLAASMIEGMADEPFGPTVAQHMAQQRRRSAGLV